MKELTIGQLSMNDYFINIPNKFKYVNRMLEKNFWKKLKEKKDTFFCLAPMADVTDAPFRYMIAKYGKPDVMWTEMVSCDGLMYKEEGDKKPRGSVFPARERLAWSFIYNETERPVVAQIFGGKPEAFLGTAKLIRELGFDGIDINMGCPDHGINKQNAGANLIKNPKLAQEIILATKEGAKDIPVSVKTRIGFNKNEVETWLPNLLEAKPAAISIHGRTRKEMSKVPAHWDIIKRGVEIAKNSDVLIIGNGDIKTIEEGEKRAKETGVDGIMIGRGVFGNPWFFNKEIKKEDLSLSETLKVMLEHARLFEKILGGKKPFVFMRKHFGSYVGGFPGARELRARLMETESADDVEKAIASYIK